MLYSPTVHSSLKMQTKMTRLCMSVRSYNQTHYSYYESVKLLSIMSAVIHTLAPFTCLGWLSLIQQSTWQFVRMNNEAVIHSRPQFRNSQSVLGWHSFHMSALSPVSQRPVTNKRKNPKALGDLLALRGCLLLCFRKMVFHLSNYIWRLNHWQSALKLVPNGSS